jgi:hypothetical protein
MTSYCPKRRRGIRARAHRSWSGRPARRRYPTIRATSPNHEGIEGADSEEVWILTNSSAIVFMCASLMESVLFFLIKEAHFYPCSLQVTSRCASRGNTMFLRSIGFAPTADGQRKEVMLLVLIDCIDTRSTCCILDFV